MYPYLPCFPIDSMIAVLRSRKLIFFWFIFSLDFNDFTFSYLILLACVARSATVIEGEIVLENTCITCRDLTPLTNKYYKMEKYY